MFELFVTHVYTHMYMGQKIKSALKKHASRG